MNNQIIFYIMGGAVAALVIIMIVYFILKNRMKSSEYKNIQRLKEGTKEKSFSSEILFQKLYVTYLKIPFMSIK